MEAFELWQQWMEIYSKTTGLEDECLVPYVLEALDDKGLKAYNSFNLTADEQKQPETIFLKF